MAILSALPLEESGAHVVACAPLGSCLKEATCTELGGNHDTAGGNGLDRVQGQRRQQLLEALSSELSSLTEAGNFSWRKPSNLRLDDGAAALKHQEALDEMRQRMAAAMQDGAPQEGRSFQIMQESKQFQEDNSRQEFLKALSKSFEQVQPTRIPARGIENSSGTGFFAELDGLRDRMQQRKFSSRHGLHNTSAGILPERDTDTQSQLENQFKDDQMIDARPQQVLQPDQQRRQLPAENKFQEQSTQEGSRVRKEPGSAEQSEITQEHESHHFCTREDNVSQRETTPCHKSLQTNAGLDELCGGDELLRWAEEVLRQARQAETSSCGTRDQYCTDSLPNRDRVPNGARKGAAAEFASAPQKRAEDFRDEMNRMAEESESECRRLSAASEERRRDFAARQENWKNRMDCAFEEIRKDFGRAPSPFRRPMPPAQPPPQRSKSRPAPGRPTSRPSSAGWQHGSQDTRSLGGKGKQETQERAEDDAWKLVEDSLAEGPSGPPIHFNDIPWPAEDWRSNDFGFGRGKSSISGVTPSDSAAVAKQLLARALRRWHPDKWRRILDRVPPSEQAAVMERVKEVAQRLLKEKAELTAPGGALYQA